MFINDLFENKNVKEGWDDFKSRAGEVAKKTADTLVSAGAAAGDAVSGALDVIPRPFDEKTYQDRVSKPYPKTDQKAPVSKKMPESLDEDNGPEIGSTVNVTTVKGRTYTGELMRMDDNSIALRVYASGGIPHSQDDTEPRSQIIVMKKDHIVSIDSELDEDLPPPENARKTQIASTLGTYKKAGAMFDKAGVQGKALDFGAGLGKGTAEIGKDAESYEPYPREDFKPNYIDATKIPSNSYSRIVNLNVLNVVPNVEGHRIRDEIVRQIGRVLAPGGMALITTRGRDVLTIKGTPGEEPMSMISSIGTYQKGFTGKELKEYVQSVLGDDFEVSTAKLGPAGVMIKKHKESVDETAAKDKLHQRHQEIRKKAGRPHPNYYKELQATFDLPDDERWAAVAELKKKYNVEQIDELKDTTLKSYAQKARMSQSRAENMRAYSYSAPKGEYAGKTSREWESDIAKRKSGIKQANDKLAKKGVAEATGDPKFDKMLKGITSKKEVTKQQKADTKQKARDAFGGMFGGGNPADSLGIRKKNTSEGDEFNTMMGNITSSESLNTREALELMSELIHQAGASYKEALQQASVSFEIDPAKLHELYQQQSSHIAEDRDSEELANEVYAEFERMYPKLASRTHERTVHAAIMDVLNYGDSDISALAQDVARAVKQEHNQEQLDELSPKTLMSYSGKAYSDAKDKLTQVKAGAPNKKELVSKAEKRVGGIKQAHSKVKDPEYGKKVVDEEWSKKYKDSINCSNPKGFSQKAHCAGRNKNEDINEDIERYVEALSRAGYEITEAATMCPECGGPAYEDKMLAEKQDACYHKVKSRYKVWPSAYASGALVRCRKAGAKNWGNKSKK